VRVTVEKLMAILDELVQNGADDSIKYHAGNLAGAIERLPDDYAPSDCIVVFE
jgi:hypothetical protein